MSSAERPDDSVIDALERHTGQRPGVHLSGADEGEEPLQTPAREDFVPRRRGDYQIRGEIARGGMGRVLKAHDPDLGRDLAIKVLDERFAGRADVLRRFVEEAQVGGQLQHPGVVPVYELGLLADDRPYFTMKLEALAWLVEARRAFDSLSAEAPGDWTSSLAQRQLETARAELGD